MPIVRAASTAAVSKKPAQLTAADVKTAKGLKSAINKALKVVRFGADLPANKLPKYDARAGVERAPNGHPLIAVQLSKPLPPGAADMETTSALVDPKKNQYYVITSGGFAGIAHGHGPLALPATSHFKGGAYSVAEVNDLTKAALHAAAPKLNHYEASVSAASWNFGSPVPRPKGVAPSISATVTLPYIDVKPEWKISINEKTHTLTVTIDGVSPNKIHPMIATRPQEIVIPAKRPADFGAEYKIVFHDHHAKVLFRTTFKNMLPA